MYMEYMLENNKYKFSKGDKDAFDLETVKSLYTDYFYEFDYIFGDIAYNKLRLKGFCKDGNKRLNKTNNIKNLDSYIKNYCATGAKWFLLEKIK